MAHGIESLSYRLALFIYLFIYYVYKTSRKTRDVKMM